MRYSCYLFKHVCVCRRWLEEKARNRLLEDQFKSLAVYEVEVKTGGMKVTLVVRQTNRLHGVLLDMLTSLAHVLGV